MEVLLLDDVLGVENEFLSGKPRNEAHVREHVDEVG